SMSLETPQEVNFFRGGSSHARGKRPPVVKGNGVTLSALLRKLIIINRQIFMPKHIIRGEKIMTSEKQYLDLCKLVLNDGNIKSDRTNTGTYSKFGSQIRFDLSKGFPLLTTKRVPFRLVASELLWFLKGDTNVKFLLEHNNNIWNEWAFKKWVESSDYTGPNMDDFGNKSQIDPEFKLEYDEQMRIFIDKILTDNAFSEKFGDLGSVYGKQWRDWKTSQNETIDQIKEVI